MRFSKNLWIGLAATVMAFAFVPASHAQALNSGASTVNLLAPLAESLTVTAGPGTVNFTLPPSGTANGSSSVAITTTWALAKTRTSVKVYAYFSSGNALTDGAGDNIPVANVTGSVNGGAAAAFTGATPYGGATGMTVFTQTIVPATGPFNSSHADTIALTISTVGLGLPAASYAGVLNVQAQAI